MSSECHNGSDIVTANYSMISFQMLPPNTSLYLLILLTQLPAFNPTANLLYVFIPIHII